MLFFSLINFYSANLFFTAILEVFFLHLNSEQQQIIRDRYGVCVNEACDTCGQIVGWVRFTRRTEPGEWCSRECRDGTEAAARYDATRKVGRPRLTPKQQRESKAKRLSYQRSLMRDRRDPVLAKNYPQPIEMTGVTDAVLAV